jgi:phosphatidylglycerophosphatase A
MNAKTDGPPPAAPSAPIQRKPRFALFIATVCGLGYIPIAPGTFGSIAGLVLTMFPFWGSVAFMGAILAIANVARHGEGSHFVMYSSNPIDPILCAQIAIAIFAGAIGVWSSDRASKFWAQKDPQRVVIDEVSGQHLALLLGCGLPIAHTIPIDINWPVSMLGLITAHSALNWKYLLLGFILFRVFDIWKPFPARQAESLPGGWGIMADDWVAGIYAAMGLWIARAFLHL